MTGKNEFNLITSKTELTNSIKALQDNIIKACSSRDNLISLYTLSKQLWEDYVTAHPNSYVSKLFSDPDKTASVIMFSCPEIEKSAYNNMTHGDIDAQLSKYISLESLFNKKKKDIDFSIQEIESEIRLCKSIEVDKTLTKFAISEVLIGIEDYSPTEEECNLTFVPIEDYIMDGEMSVEDISLRNSYLLRLEFYYYKSDYTKQIVKKEYHHMYISEINKGGKSMPEQMYWLEDTTLYGNVEDFKPVDTSVRYLKKYANESAFLTVQLQAYINNLNNC